MCLRKARADSGRNTSHSNAGNALRVLVHQQVVRYGLILENTCGGALTPEGWYTGIEAGEPAGLDETVARFLRGEPLRAAG